MPEDFVVLRFSSNRDFEKAQEALRAISTGYAIVGERALQTRRGADKYLFEKGISTYTSSINPGFSGECIGLTS